MKPDLQGLSDRLSPMLVKDLRHGLRTRSFIAFFLILQGLLILTIFGDLGQSMGASTVRRSGASEVFWFFIGAALLYFLPLRGFSAISNEIKSNTLELVFLSHLTAWRIVVGKWASLMAQTFLFVCAVLPYMLLRYFVGSVNLIEDIQILLVMFLASACLTAFTVAVSAFNSKVATVFFSFGGIIFVIMFGAFVAAFGRRSSPISEAEFYIVFLSLGTLFLFTMLLVGASKIAPPAENFARWKRIMALLVLAVSISFLAAGIAPQLSLAAAMILSFFICFFALGEEPRFITSIAKPFVRRGWPGRLAGYFFYPGWPSGIRFTFLVVGILLGVTALSSQFNDIALNFSLGLFAALIAPLALVKIIPPDAEGRPRLSYFAVQIGLVAGSYALFILTEIFDVWKELVEFILPHIGLIQIVFHRSSFPHDWNGVPFYYFWLSVFSMIILFAKMIPLDRQMHHAEKMAQQEIDAEKAIDDPQNAPTNSTTQISGINPARPDQTEP